MRWPLLLMVWVLLGNGGVESKELPQVPAVEANKKTEVIPNKTDAKLSLAVTDTTKGAKPNIAHSEEEGTEFWPAFF